MKNAMDDRRLTGCYRVRYTPAMNGKTPDSGRFTFEILEAKPTIRSRLRIWWWMLAHPKQTLALRKIAKDYYTARDRAIDAMVIDYVNRMMIEEESQDGKRTMH